MLLLKCRSGGRVEFYQDNVLMDEWSVLIWIKKILCPHIADAPDGTAPILLLDLCCCHVMSLVV